MGAKRKLDILYVQSTEKPYNDLFYNELTARGVVSLLDVLQKNNFAVEGISNFYSTYVDRSFDIYKELRQIEVSLFLMVDIWSYFGVYNKLETIKKLKGVYPNIPIVVGGQVASIFWKDVIELPGVDFLIRGDGEKSIVMLAERLRDNTGDMENIPGLVYKENDEVIANETPHFLTSEEFNSLDYLNFDLIKDYRKAYKKLTRQSFIAYPVLIHKGCKKICRRCYAFGKPSSATVYMTRPPSGPVYRSVDNIKKDMKKAIEQGIKRILLTSLLFNDKKSEEEFLEKVKYPKLKILAVCEAPETHHYEFLSKSHGNFHPDSTLLFSGLGGTQEYLDKSGISLDLKEMHKWLETLKWRKLVSIDLHLDDSVEAVVKLIEMYRNNPSVLFLRNEMASNSLTELKFSDFCELSRQFDSNLFMSDKLKEKMDYFNGEIKRKKLEHKFRSSTRKISWRLKDT